MVLVSRRVTGPLQSIQTAMHKLAGGDMSAEISVGERRDEIGALGGAAQASTPQATYTDPLNPIFNSDSPQPSFEGTFGETHVVNANMTNQFLFNVMWYSSLFTNQNLAQANQLLARLLAAVLEKRQQRLLAGEVVIVPRGELQVAEHPEILAVPLLIFRQRRIERRIAQHGRADEP